MTTEPKAEGGEAVGWVFQHDENGRMTFCPNDGVNTPDVFAELNPGYTLCSAAYTHPTPSAVEALARAALELGDANFAEYCGEVTESMEPDDSKVSYPEERCSITFGMIRRIRLALAHPEIAALLKEKES